MEKRITPRLKCQKREMQTGRSSGTVLITATSSFIFLINIYINLKVQLREVESQLQSAMTLHLNLTCAKPNKMQGKFKETAKKVEEKYEGKFGETKRELEKKFIETKRELRKRKDVSRKLEE